MLYYKYFRKCIKNYVAWVKISQKIFNMLNEYYN